MTELTTEFFISLERQVWQALLDGNREADLAMLSQDFLGVYPSGLSDRAGHADQLIDGPTVTAYEMHDAQIRVVTEEHVLLTYRAIFERPHSGPEGWWVTSLWSLLDSSWKNVFSQDTVIDSR